MTGPDRRDLGRVFNEVPGLSDRVRPGYPGELFADLVAIPGMNRRSPVLEVGCGYRSGDTRSLAALGYPVTAIEPGAAMAALARQRLAAFRDVEVETSAFEEWDDGRRLFDVLVTASARHWVDPSIGWRRAHDLLHPRGWMALLGNIVMSDSAPDNRSGGQPNRSAATALRRRCRPKRPYHPIANAQIHSPTPDDQPRQTGDPAPRGRPEQPATVRSRTTCRPTRATPPICMR